MAEEVVKNYREHVSPEVLARVAGLELRARLIVEGTLAGLHRSPYHGWSVEFAQHRQYSQGDDLRHVDWKVLARTDKYYVKQYQQETNLACLFAVDASGSMGFRGEAEGLSKLEYGAAMAGALAYLLLRQRDAVGLALFDERVRRFVRASNDPGQWGRVIEELAAAGGAVAAGREAGRVGAVLDDLAGRLARRSMVVVISDLFDEVGAVLRGLQHLRHGGHEVIVLHVVDAAELTLPLKGLTLFEGMEGEAEMLTEPGAIRREYVARMEGFVSTLQRGCRDMQVDYWLSRTDAELDVSLRGLLAMRRRGGG